MFVKNGNNVLAWEKTRSKDEKWKTGKIQLYPGITTTESVSGQTVVNQILAFFFSDSTKKTKHLLKYPGPGATQMNKTFSPYTSRVYILEQNRQGN